MADVEKSIDEYRRAFDDASASFVDKVTSKASAYKKAAGAALGSAVAVASTLGFGADSKLVAAVVALAAVFGVVVAPKNRTR